MKRSQLEKLHNELRQETLALLDIVWALAEEQGLNSFKDFAREAGLCEATLYRYWGGAFKRPQLMTLQKMCRVVGLSVTFGSAGMTTSLEDLQSIRQR